MKTNLIKNLGKWAGIVLFVGITVICIYQSKQTLQEQYHDVSLVTIQYQPGPLSDLR